MALKECGTFAAYRRHLKASEVPCEPCKAAARQQKADRDARKRDESGLAVTAKLETVADDDFIDPLEEARDNLRIIRAALRSNPPHNTIAALSKRRDEVVDRIKSLEPETGEVDEIDAIISDLAGWSSSRASGT